MFGFLNHVLKLLIAQELNWNNDTHMEELCFIQFSTRIYWNRSLAASDLFHMFTQSVKFSIFHTEYRCLKKVIHEIDTKNKNCYAEDAFKTFSRRFQHFFTKRNVC